MTLAANSDYTAYRTLFFNSLLAFTIAFIVSTLVHEGAHAVTARALGVHAVLHHNFVSTSGAAEATDVARLWVPASGPLVSLLLGVACLIWVRMSSTATLVSLTVLWLGLLACVVFFGYLMLGPLVPYGDTGKVYAMLGVSRTVGWVVALAGIATLVWIVRSTVPDFERHVLRAEHDDDRRRARNGHALIAFPIIAGAAVTTLLSLPVPTFISLLHPMTSPFAVFMAYGLFRRRTTPLPPGSLRAEKFSVPLAIVAILLAILSRALVPGLPLG